ncbi:dolichyl-phosphate-mannose--protein mannosyltransferase [Subtercola frigoramans]|uniref:Polyprenol-phosphate-mannose--protein mannosyltransferase n=1 Tax=Subtercola frigoramans TaxID=120298 RepID=A0ABS2L6I2_9MICO|nr:phospholipid carrier-dependent glycosyltransferase [Subtercola frigoramans]MBM7472693.1 dolichyl-phosphate-mannose--protein O-mannosyl transferase [Subtercola frigoramans]
MNKTLHPHDADTAALAPPSVGADLATTRLDRWWGRVLSTPARHRRSAWIAPIIVTSFAAFLRLWNLGWPNSLVFDETYYVKDALSMSRLGYEGTWPDDANAQVNRGQTDGFSADAEFAVHPPLGKWIIQTGFALFGRDSTVGWRIAVAVCGILVVLLTYLIARHLFGSIVLASIAGLLIGVDGQAIVLSRTAILDGPLTLLCLAGVGATLLDRRSQNARRMIGRRLLWRRPWLVVAGVLFGLACGTKWSAIWFLLAFAVFVAITDWLASRRSRSGAEPRVSRPSRLVSIRRAAYSTGVLGVSAAIAYLATWTGWFVTDGGSDRHWVQQHNAAWGGGFAWVPPIIQNFVHHHLAMLAFNVNLSTPHGYQANPLTWLLYTQPLSMYTRTTSGGIGPCGESVCRETAWLMVNPIIWWASVAAVIVVLVRFVLRREWMLGVILLGVVAGYLPWLLFMNRTIFQFYSIIFEPYLILALTAVLGYLLGSRTDPPRIRRFGIAVVGGFLLVCLAVSAFFYPLWVASPPVTNGFVDLHFWLVSWRFE